MISRAREPKGTLARLDEQSHPLALNLPSQIVWWLTVGQGGLTPARVEEADAGTFVRQIGGGSFDKTAILAVPECC
jgi:hypothetical protein